MIFFIEEDTASRELVLYSLRQAGYQAEGFSCPSELWAAMEEGRDPFLILLDAALPEEDGISVLGKLRASPRLKEVPVIFVSDSGAEYDTVVALDSGADDYLTKPLRMMELLARVRALLRRTGGRQEPEPAEEYRSGILSVSPSSHTVCVAGQAVALTLKEFDLLCMLLDNAGIVLTRDRILDKVWRDTMGRESRTVDVHIRTLRQKLGEAGAMIETVRGIGYKFSGRNNEDTRR